MKFLEHIRYGDYDDDNGDDVDEEEVEEIKAKHQGGSAAFPRTDSTHSESTCFLFPCKIHFCYSVFLLIFAIEFKSTKFYYNRR